MSGWVLSVCGMVFLTAVLYAILPEGKTGKIIKSVFALMCLTVLIKPVINLKDADFNIDTAFSTYEINLQNNYLDFILKQKENYLEKGIKETLNSFGVYVETATINLCYDEKMNISTKKASVQIKKGEIIDDSAHIVIIDKVFEYLSAYVSADKNLIEIYE